LYLAQQILSMNKLTLFFGLLCAFTLITSCEEQQRGIYTPPKEYAEQRAIDNDSLLSFLQTRFYNYEEYENAASNEFVSFTIDTIQGANADKRPLMDDVTQIDLRVKDTDGVYHDHTAYVLKIREGVNETAPSIADSVFVTYKGMLLNLNKFDERTTPVWFESLANIKGFSALMPYINPGNYTTNSDGTYQFDGFGTAAIFMPSALGYYNQLSGSIPSYSPLIFAVDLYTYNQTDHDGDGVASIDEDVDQDTYFDDDTDGDGVANYADADDDNDGVLTKDEYDANNDGIADDTDADGTPDYLDKD
jgi:FKBP-type peptidyl-prolyl cis-trans isomerase FkpA